MRAACVWEQVANTPWHMTQSLQRIHTLKSNKIANLDAAPANHPTFLFLCLSSWGSWGDQWSSRCLWSCWWEDLDSELEKSIQGQSCSVRLREALKPQERESRCEGGTSHTSSIDCRERDGTEGQRRGEEGLVCVYDDVWLRQRVYACLQTFALCVLSLAELAVRVWLKIWGNEQREGEEQNLDTNTDGRIKTGQVQRNHSKQREEKKRSY